MKLNGLLELGLGLPAFRGLVDSLADGQVPAAPAGLYHAARPYTAALLARSLNRPLVVLTARSSRARQWVDELRVWLPDEVPVHNFADPDALPYERIPWAPETRQRRLEALVSLLVWESANERIGEPTDDAKRNTQYVVRNTQYAPVVVASARALMQPTLPVREMRARPCGLSARASRSISARAWRSGWAWATRAPRWSKPRVSSAVAAGSWTSGRPTCASRCASSCSATR